MDHQELPIRETTGANVSEDSHLLAEVVEEIFELEPKSPEQIGSKSILSGPGYRVLILSFPKGYLLKEHRTPKTLLIQALDGEFDFRFLDQEHQVVPGKMFRLAPSVLHEVEAREAGRLQLVLLDP